MIACASEKMAAAWCDTWAMACPNTDVKSRKAWLGARGSIPAPLLDSVHGGDGRHFCIHATTGLEVIAAEEVARTASCSNVHALVGRVIFTSDAHPTTLVRSLRSANLVSYCVWAAPVPEMPFEKLSAPARGPEHAERLAAWMARFDELLTEHVVPHLRRVVPVWRRAVGAAAAERDDETDKSPPQPTLPPTPPPTPPPIRFRATVQRGGERTTMLGVSSTAMAAAIGGRCVEDLGWCVDLRDFDVEVSIPIATVRRSIGASSHHVAPLLPVVTRGRC